jgi:hypothetical protein
MTPLPPTFRENRSAGVLAEPDRKRGKYAPPGRGHPR